jgi:RP/EB family microtubule-associated protein
MSVNDGSKVGMMDPAYFVGKRILLEWINSLLRLDIKKIEQTCSGAVACQIVHSIYPRKVAMSKVNFGAKYDYEYIKNYKVLQSAFGKLKVSKVVPVDKLVRGKYQDNLEFMQWFKSFFDLNGGSIEGYNPVEARARSKNVPKPAAITSSPSSAPSSRTTGRYNQRRPTIKKTTKENAGAPALPATKLKETNKNLVRQVHSLKLEVEALQQTVADKEKEANEDTQIKMALDGLEKERDFYFNKLREIETYLQEFGEADEMEDGPQKEVIKHVFAVLYATDDADFEAPVASPEKVDINASALPSKLPVGSAN